MQVQKSLCGIQKDETEEEPSLGDNNPITLILV